MSHGKIGIGVITMGVRDIHPNIPGLCVPDAVIRIQTDHERVGPAITRNRCLKYLMEQGCEHIFMFDDDCYPLMKGWESYFIDTAHSVGVHFLGLPNAFESKLLSHRGEFAKWDSIVGCFSYQTRKLMEVVGYYNTAYTRYGSEDVGRNWRVQQSGLVAGNDGFPAPLRSANYIFSEDVYQMNPKPNLSHEEKRKFITLNEPTFLKEVHSTQLYYPPE